MIASVLTQSAIRTYLECPRKYQWSYDARIRPIKQADALRFGSLFHGVFERIDKYQDWPDICDWVLAEAADQYEAQTVLSLAAAHRWHYAAEDEHVTIEHVESTFTMPVAYATMQGKADAIIVLPDGRRAVREYKTSSEDIGPGSLYWQRLRMDLQVSLYKQAFDCDTVIYDVVRKPTIRPHSIPVRDTEGFKVVTDDQTGERVYLANGKPRQSAGEGMTLQTRPETPEEWGDRLREDIKARPAYYFQRQEIAGFDSDWIATENDIADVGKAMRLQLYPRNTAACCRYGKCPYFELCSNNIEPSDDVPFGFYRPDTPHEELADDEPTATPTA